MNSDQRRLPPGGEGEPRSRRVSHGDDIAECFEQDAGEGDTRGALAVDEFEDLGHFDDGAEGDDADADGLGDEEREAGARGVDVEIED